MDEHTRALLYSLLQYSNIDQLGIDPILALDSFVNDFSEYMAFSPPSLLEIENNGERYTIAAWVLPIVQKINNTNNYTILSSVLFGFIPSHNQYQLFEYDVIASFDTNSSEICSSILFNEKLLPSFVDCSPSLFLRYTIRNLISY